MRPHMTRTAWRQGMKNAAVCLGAMLVALGLLILPGAVAMGRVEWPLIIAAGAELFVLVMLGNAWNWVYGVTARGRLLVDCGPHPSRGLFLVYAVLNPVIVIPGFLIAAEQNPAYRWAVLAFGLVAAVMGGGLFGAFALGRLQIRENGVWQYWGLAPWRNLVAYHWGPENTLILQGTGLGALLQGALPVPPELREEVDRILATRIAGRWEDVLADNEERPAAPTSTAIRE